MLNLLLFRVKWNLIIVATGDVAPRKKKTHQQKKQKTNQKTSAACKALFGWLHCLPLCVFSVRSFFFIILNKSLFIAVVDFLSRTTILCYYFFMRPADLFFHGRGADECQPFRSLPATISHQIYVLTGTAWSPVPI